MIKYIVTLPRNFGWEVKQIERQIFSIKKDKGKFSKFLFGVHEKKSINIFTYTVACSINPYGNEIYKPNKSRPHYTRNSSDGACLY